MTLEEKMDALCNAFLSGNDQEARRKLDRMMQDAGPTVSQPETIIRQILLELGAPDHLIGHAYTVRAIELAMTDSLYINNMVKRLYPGVAAMFDTTPSRVERAIRHLIEVVFMRCDYACIEKYFGATIDSRKGKPTNSEFIARLANVVRSRM